MKILVLNSGSSSYKFALYDVKKPLLGTPEKPLWNHLYEWKRNGDYSLEAQKKAVEEHLRTMPIALSEVDAVGHRVVHGGEMFTQPVVITEQVKEAIKKLSWLAPLHNPQNLEGIEVIQRILPHIPQVAVFDTAFHTTLAPEAATYAGPYSWSAMGIRRYGFHGISYEYCAARAAVLLQRNDLKIICCHLGNGASLAAIDKGKSVDTTMGFTPLEGLMMGTRSGSIDPSILLFLQRQGKSPDELFQLLNYESGLLGISGKTSDMRDIIALRESGDDRASLAFDMYIHSLKRNIGAMAAVLGGVDALIFTAGVGENASLVRQAACQGLDHLGIAIDVRKNFNCNPDTIISSDAKAHVVVMRTQEDWCIACTIQGMRSYGAI